MNVSCPKCKHIILPEFINVSTDLAKCNNCGNLFNLSAIVEDNELANLAPPPHGSRITVNRPGENIFEIKLPSKKLSSSDIFPLVFSLFFMGFSVLWITGAYQASGFFALFGVPFFIIGLLMVFNIINSLDEEHYITFYKDKLELLKNKPAFSKSIIIDYNNIYSVNFGPLNTDNPFSLAKNVRLMPRYSMMKGTYDVPAINHGVNSTTFFEYASKAEQEWIIDFLTKIVKKHKTTSKNTGRQ